MKQLLKLFSVFWAGLFLLSFFTAKGDLPFFTRLWYTAALALIAPVMSLLSNRKPSDKQTNTNFIIPQNAEIHLPSDPKVLYRIKNNKIYKGMAPSPTYEVKGNQVYPYLDPKPVYQIKENKVYRTMEPTPILEIKGNKIHPNLSSKVAYEIKVLK